MDHIYFNVQKFLLYVELNVLCNADRQFNKCFVNLEK